MNITQKQSKKPSFFGAQKHKVFLANQRFFVPQKFIKFSKESQSAVEFIVLASFMLLVILGFFAVTSSRMLEAKEESNRKTAEDIAEFAYREIEIAKSVNDGYTRVFAMPQTVNGVNYSISIVDNRELVVGYLGNEHVKFLPSNVTGTIGVGFNEIKKINESVYIGGYTPTVECNDNIDNDGDGAIDLSDAGCIDKYDDDETNCGDTKCEGGESCLSCSFDCGVCQSICHVTNLQDSGPGSLRDAVSQGNCSVVFDVGGEILLNDFIYVKGAFVTIDGFTAPPPGISLRNRGLVIRGNQGAHDVTVRGIRVRNSSIDGIQIAYGAYNVVIDHVSINGSADGNLDITEGSNNVTVSWSIFSEPNGTEKNMLIKYNPSRISVHHNIFTEARQRNPQVRIDDAGTNATNTTLDLRNNIIWDWSGGYGTLVWYGPWANIVNNYYSSNGGDKKDALTVNTTNARAYVSGNIDPEDLGFDINSLGNEAVPFDAPPVATQDACTAAQLVIADAGVRPLDSIDQQYVSRISLVGCAPPKIFVLQNASGINVASFDAAGSLTLKGILEQNSTHAATGTNEFRVQNGAGDDFAIIDLTNGNMYIDGTLSQNMNPIPPSTSIYDFGIFTSAGELVALIKENGELLLKGGLTENGNP